MSRSELPGGDVADICQALLEVPSEYGDEERLADLVEWRVAALARRSERIGNAIVARTGDDGPAVALVGHLDTVPNWPGGSVERSDERLVGRGAADMKGGVAVMLALLERLQASAVPVSYVFYDREEGPNVDNGIHRTLRDTTVLGASRFAVVLEPTTNTVHAGAVGTMNADVVFTGRAGHSARPWHGSNAIERAAPALARFARRVARPVEIDGLVFHDTVTVTTAGGGTARNVVPEEFVLGVNVRVAPNRSLAAARAEVEQLAGAEATVTWLDESPPALPRVSDPAIRAFLDATGVEVQPKQAWTDVATLQAAGIPAINFGPGEPAQAHRTGEWVSIAALRACEATLAEFLQGQR